MKAFAILIPVLVLAACNDHQKAPDDVPLGKSRSPQELAATPQAGQNVVAGTIAVADALKDKVPANATLFIVARPKGAMGGPPILVKKVAGVTYPYTFELKAEDAMMQGTPVPDELDVSARIDQDGDAMTKSPGDLFGKTEFPTARMTNGVMLVISEQIPAAQ